MPIDLLFAHHLQAQIMRGQKVKSYKASTIPHRIARILKKSKFIARDTVQIWMENVSLGGRRCRNLLQAPQGSVIRQIYYFTPQKSARDTVQIWMENVSLGGAAVETYCKPTKGALYAKYARIS